MKVTHLNTYTEGGAAEASLRLHLALLGNNIDSRFLALYKSDCELPNVEDFRNHLSNISALVAKFKNKTQTLAIDKISEEAGELFGYLNSKWKVHEHPLISSSEIIHLHWVSSFVDLPNFFAGTKKKIVWTLHDHFPFSGGFHYPPPLMKSSLDAVIKQQKATTQKLFEKHLIDFVFPSEHLKSLALQSGILGNSKMHVIKNPVDTELFKPSDKTLTRNKLGIPTHHKVLFFLSDHVSYQRKGFSLLEEALKQLSFEVTLLVAGRGKLPLQLGKAQVRQFGLVKDKNLLIDLYNAADILVNPSLDDISSNTVIEAMACGIPSVAFNSGGIPELISEINGIIAQAKTAASLKNAIELALAKPFDATAIRSLCIKNHSFAVVAKKYLQVYGL